MNYPLIKRFTLPLIISARQLEPYFQAHSIQAVTNNPLKLVLAKPNYSRRLLKWSLELSVFDISYSSRMAIKSQVLADFLVFGNSHDIPINLKQLWRLYVDDSPSELVMGVDIVLKAQQELP